MTIFAYTYLSKLELLSAHEGKIEKSLFHIFHIKHVVMSRTNTLNLQQVNKNYNFLL